MKISRQILWLLFVFIAPLSSWATNTYPNTTQDITKNTDNEFDIGKLVTQQLEALAIEYAEKGYRSEFIIGNIDPYHKIKTCDISPEMSINREPIKQNRITTKLKCNGTKPWKLYISSEFNIYAQSVATSTNIRRGQIITEHDLVLKETVINKNHYSHYHKLSDVIGMVAKRSLRADTNIQPGHLSPPKLIKRGDNVVIVASNSAISVRMNGTALSDGALGQQISVQNTQSKRVVKARVTKTGLVTIVL